MAYSTTVTRHKTREVAVGDRVSGEGHIVCGTCRNCRAGRRQMCIRTIGLGVQRDGAFAQYLSLPASNVWVHHPDVDPDLGAISDPQVAWLPMLVIVPASFLLAGVVAAVPAWLAGRTRPSAALRTE